MNKQEAIEAMNRGEKVTHTYFCRGEWMTIRGGMIEFEDGVSCSPGCFWHDRTGEGWEQGYSLFQEPTNQPAEQG